MRYGFNLINEKDKKSIQKYIYTKFEVAEFTSLKVLSFDFFFPAKVQ